MIRNWRWSRLAVAVLIVATACASELLAAASDRDASAQQANGFNAGLYLKVQLPASIKLTKLKPGDVVKGNLSTDVYSADRKLFPAGSSIELSVDHLDKRRRIPNDHWPGVIKLFTPRHESYPAFKTAKVLLPDGEHELQVSLISVSRMREVHAQAKKDKSGKQLASERGAVEVKQSAAKKPAPPVMILEALNPDIAQGPAQPGSAEGTPDELRSSGPQELPMGTRCKIVLLGSVSASKSRPGDAVEARLLEPVLLNSKVVLPAGSLVEGSVMKKTPPRWLSRAGSLYISFTQVILPGRAPLPITASVAGAELNQRSHTRIDPEGGLRGERPGKVWMAINLGVTAGIAKEADDTVQLIIESIVSTATDASTAGTARIVSSCVSGIYLATRKGRDVVLPRFTEMEIALDRPVTVDASFATSAAAGGK